MTADVAEANGATTAAAMQRLMIKSDQETGNFPTAPASRKSP